MRTMYDAVQASRIPSNAEIVAGYVNGRYKWSDADWARFPNATHVRIQVYIPGQPVIMGLGDVLDVEAGDAPKATAAAKAWVDSLRAAGRVPCIYTSRSTQHYLQFPATDYWLAEYTGTPHLIPGTVATQYKDGSNGTGYDLSLVADGWPWHAQPAPAPTPAPAPSQPVSITTGPTTEDFLTPHNVHVPKLDGNGNGYVDMGGVSAVTVVSVIGNGQDPATAGYGKCPCFDREDINGIARINIHGGPANGAVDFVVWTTP